MKAKYFLFLIVCSILIMSAVTCTAPGASDKKVSVENVDSISAGVDTVANDSIKQ